MHPSHVVPFANVTHVVPLACPLAPPLPMPPPFPNTHASTHAPTLLPVSLSATLAVMGVLEVPQAGPGASTAGTHVPSHLFQHAEGQIVATGNQRAPDPLHPGGADPASCAFSTLDGATSQLRPGAVSTHTMSRSHLLVPPLTPTGTHPTGAGEAALAAGLFPGRDPSRPASPAHQSLQAQPPLPDVPWRPLDACLALVRATLPAVHTLDDLLAWCMQVRHGVVTLVGQHTLDSVASLSELSSSEEGDTGVRRTPPPPLASLLVQCLAWSMCHQRTPSDLTALCHGHKVAVTGSDDMQVPSHMDVTEAEAPLACLSLCQLSSGSADRVFDTLVSLVCDFGTVAAQGDELQGGATALLLQLLHIGAAQPNSTGRHTPIVSLGQLLSHAAAISVSRLS